jgi:hypothetical protein
MAGTPLTRQDCKVLTLLAVLTLLTLVSQDPQCMADKVKVCMFLPPSVAHAIKVQAARHGGGVSDLIGGMFICAHCREPIADEFIVGKPKLVEPNRCAVLFHRNREACVAASGTRISFGARCPQCSSTGLQSFDRNELQALLQSKNVRFHCRQCDNRWNATEE